MEGGVIGGNTATNDYDGYGRPASAGGGVLVGNDGTFNKTGGIIYGSDGGGNSNTATNGDGYGHAVYGPSTTVRDLTW
jgi:hypothetical protein